MKKILGILAIFAIVGGLSFAQSISVYNEVYSKTAEQHVAEGAGLTFWGIRNRTGINISTDKWGVDARYQLLINSNNGNYSEVTRFEGSPNQVNVWVKPVQGLTLRVGNDLGRNVAAGSMTAWDGRLGRMASFDKAVTGENTVEEGLVKSFDAPDANIFGGNSSRYAETGFTAEVTAIPYLTLAFNLPAPAGNLWYQEVTDPRTGNKIGEKFIMPFNVAADVNIANLFDVGAVYRGGFGDQKDFGATVGLYADFVGVKGLKIQAGWTGVVNANSTFTGMMLNNDLNTIVSEMSVISALIGGVLPNGGESADKYYNDDWKMASLIDLGVQYKFNNGLLLAAAAEMGLGYNWAFPLTVAAYFELPNIVDTFGISTRVIWENVAFVNKGNFFNDNPTASYGAVRINPNLKYSIGANAFELGANFQIGYANATNDTIKAVDTATSGVGVNSFSESFFGFNIPVKWTHYFN